MYVDCQPPVKTVVERLQSEPLSSILSAPFFGSPFQALRTNPLDRGGVLSVRRTRSIDQKRDPLADSSTGPMQRDHLKHRMRFRRKHSEQISFSALPCRTNPSSGPKAASQCSTPCSCLGHPYKGHTGDGEVYGNVIGPNLPLKLVVGMTGEASVKQPSQTAMPRCYKYWDALAGVGAF